MDKKQIKVLFCDLGGVLLTNGWDHNSRKKAAEAFGYDYAEVDSRHGMMFGDYEVGKISLDQYLHYVVFFKPRNFTKEEFIKFMLDQSQPYPEMLDYVKRLKKEHDLKVVILSNEGRELTMERFERFGIREIGDFFLVSCFTGLRKPDLQVFRMALDLVQVPSVNIAYLDDRQLFIDIAKEMGIHAIRHTDLESTKKALAQILS